MSDVQSWDEQEHGAPSSPDDYQPGGHHVEEQLVSMIARNQTTSVTWFGEHQSTRELHMLVFVLRKWASDLKGCYNTCRSRYGSWSWYDDRVVLLSGCTIRERAKCFELIDLAARRPGMAFGSS